MLTLPHTTEKNINLRQRVDLYIKVKLKIYKKTKEQSFETLGQAKKKKNYKFNISFKIYIS